MDGAVIGRGSIVAGGAMVREGSVFAPGSIIAGVPAKQIAERDNARANRLNAWQYHWNAQAYRRGQHRSWTGPEYEAWLREIAAKIESRRRSLGGAAKPNEVTPIGGRMDRRMRGQCACGAVQYEVDSPLGPLVNCHCRSCRRAHGAAFATSALVQLRA